MGWETNLAWCPIYFEAVQRELVFQGRPNFVLVGVSCGSAGALVAFWCRGADDLPPRALLGVNLVVDLETTPMFFFTENHNRK